MTDQKTEAALSSDVTEVRAQKLAKLRETIGDVYPAHFHRTITNAELAEKYKDIEPDTLTGDIVTVAGRVLSKELGQDEHRRLLDVAIHELPAVLPSSESHGGVGA